ncbi:amidohydrolase [Corynebacterium sp. MSK195]|uniref:M20 metallopeptidase family protein n=1 Tax=Corynebacterium sp. MSK195 TaxID=3050216 RepID=UPI00254B2E4A|nr:amidohydrolase [Corynebacterium sp. MSK195]MDK8669309.1 amidohydrolase [Corynebacterium sp. MSK195]
MNEELKDLSRQWMDEFQKNAPKAIALRRTIHQNPQLSGEEGPTRELMLKELGIHFDPVASTGAIGRVGPATGPSIGMRGELDALPVSENTNVEWSAASDKMHACGHDVHLAALAGVINAAKKLDLPFGLVPILQPREETYPSGALDISESGLLESHEVNHVIGAHVHPAIQLGSIAAGSGFVNAAAGEIEIKIVGKGGHGAYPHKASDVAIPTAQIALGLSEVVRRTSDPMSPAVVSIGSLSAGQGAANVLPQSGTIFATIRSTSTEKNNALASQIDQFATYTAKSLGCFAKTIYTPGEPALVNSSSLADKFESYAAAVDIPVAETMRSLGADDFSYYGENCPSLMCFVGVKEGNTPSLHDAEFLPPDEAITYVAKAFITGYVAAADNLMET